MHRLGFAPTCPLVLSSVACFRYLYRGRVAGTRAAYHATTVSCSGTQTRSGTRRSPQSTQPSVSGICRCLRSRHRTLRSTAALLVLRRRSSAYGRSRTQPEEANEYMFQIYQLDKSSSIQAAHVYESSIIIENKPVARSISLDIYSYETSVSFFLDQRCNAKSTPMSHARVHQTPKQRIILNLGRSCKEAYLFLWVGSDHRNDYGLFLPTLKPINR